MLPSFWLRRLILRADIHAGREALGIAVDVILLEQLLNLLARVTEVGFGAEPLANDGDGVVVPGRLILVLNGSDVDFLLVNHDHHLPLALVAGNSTVLAATEDVGSHILVRPLWLRLYYELFHICLFGERPGQLLLHLSELRLSLVLTNLAAQTDQHWSIFLLVISIFSFDLLIWNAIRNVLFGCFCYSVYQRAVVVNLNPV